MNRRSDSRHAACASLLAGLCVLARATAGLAQDDPTQQLNWRTLVTQAQQESAAGDHAQALHDAQAAGEIHMSPSLRRIIANEQLHLGQLAAAMTSANLCVQEAQLDSNHDIGSREAQTCQGILHDIQGQLGSVVVHVAGALPPGMHVTVGGTELPSGLLDRPYAVLPGEVVVEASAPGFDAVHREVEVVAGQEQRVDVALHATGAEASSAAVMSNGAVTPPSDRDETATPASHHGGTQRMLGWVALGVGAAGLVTGIIGSLVRVDAYNAILANPTNPDHDCDLHDPQCVTDHSNLDLGTTLEWVGYVSGGVLAATGLVLLLTAPSSHPSRPAAAGLACGVGPGTVGATCVIRF